MIKSIKHKGKEIRIEVLLIEPQPPAYQDTAARYTIKASIWYVEKDHHISMVIDPITTGWLYQKDVAERHLTPEITFAEKEAKKEIERMQKKVELLNKLKEKGFS